MRLERMTVGMTLHSYGNDGTVMRRRCSFPVRVLDIDWEKRMVWASYNHNPPRWVAERHATKWRIKPCAATR